MDIVSILVFLILLACGKQTEVEKYHTSAESQIKLAHQLEKHLVYLSFEDTINAFPYLVKNMRAPILSQLVQDKQGCESQLFFKNSTIKFVFINNTVYTFFDKQLGQDVKIRIQIFQKYLNRIVKKFVIPDLYMVLHIRDELKFKNKKDSKRKICQALPVFVFDKNCSAHSFDKNKFLIPDIYVVNGWADTIKSIKQASLKRSWQNKTSKALFRGVSSSPYFDYAGFQSRAEIFRYYHRAAYVWLSYQFPQDIDARFVGNENYLTKKIKQLVGNQTTHTNFLLRQQQVQYKYQLSADGFAAAWARIPYLFFSQSVIFKPISEQIQWFYGKMIHYKNIILVKDDLSDLVGKIKELKRNDTKAFQIIKNANAMAQQYLTAEAIQKFGAESLIKYANIQKFNLTDQQKEFVKNGTDIGEVLKKKRQQQIVELDRIYIEKWKLNKKLVSFQNIIKFFPVLKSNFNVFKIIQALQKNGISENFIKVLILQNKVFIEGQIKNQNHKQLIRKFLTGIITDTQLPNVFFLILLQQEKIQLTLQQKYHTILRQLPIFVQSKNISSYTQQTHFLFPDINTIYSWSQKKQTIIVSSSKQKIKKAFFRGCLQPQTFLQNISKFNKKQNNLYQLSNVLGFTLLAHERPDLIDAKLIPSNCQVEKNLLQFLENEYGKQNIIDDTKTEDPEFKYRYYLSIDNSNASLNVVPVLLSRSIILKPLSKRIFWFDDKIIPNSHFIPLSDDLSDLISKLQILNSNNSMVERITEMAAYAVSKQQTISYISNILFKYASYQKLQINEQIQQAIKAGETIQNAILYYKDDYIYISRRKLLVVIIIFIVIFVALSSFKILKIYKQKQNNKFEKVVQMVSLSSSTNFQSQQQNVTI